MTDIALTKDADGRLDISLEGADVAQDTGLRTAVIMSLLSDRLANVGDELPGGGTDRRGWWADAWSSVDGDRFGSRLWLLAREKDLAIVRNKAETYAREALTWLIEDGVASAVSVEASTVRSGLLGLFIEIERRDGGAESLQLEYVWENL